MWRRVGAFSARFLLALVISVLVLPYAWVPIYSLPAPTPFSGTSLFNPYASLTPQWQRANFHAHARAWGGLTSGHQSADSVYAAYAARGYDVIGISNYHLITRAAGDSLFLPVYEHGFSIRKTHQLVIGARRVVNADIPFWQTTHAKQYLLARLHDSAALTTVAHPYLRLGYDTAQLARLGGFDLLEVRSHWSDASAWWDAVLTSGNPIWAIGNDDSHDVTRAGEVGVVWTVINAPGKRPVDILAALRAGQMYVVAGSIDSAAASLLSVTVHGDTITTRFDRPMQEIQVITDSGVVRAREKGTAMISYVLQPSDHYARVIGTSGGNTLYLNPVIRSQGRPGPRGIPELQLFPSILSRASAIVVWIGAMLLLFRIERRRRRVVKVLALCAVALSQAGTLHAQSAGPSPLPFRVGERNEYDLKFGVITVGSGSLSVTGPDTIRGRETIRLRYEINGKIPFFRVHDVMESWFDPKNMLSMRFTQDLHEGSKHYDRLFDFYPDELIVLERGKPRAATVAAPLDDASFIFFVRTLKLEVGQTLSFSRYFRPEANPVTIRVLRKETITVPAGTFNTVVVKPIIRTSGIFSEGGQAELWFSDDSLHTLIQMKAKLAFGSLSLYLRPTRASR